MPMNINCKHNDSCNGCTNPAVPRTMLGLGSRVCVEFVTWGHETCPVKEPLHRPSPPPGPDDSPSRSDSTITNIDLPTATQRINDILRSLEVSTGSVVESIELRDLDATTVDSLEQQLVRSVQIEMKRLPGTKWC